MKSKNSYYGSRSSSLGVGFLSFRKSAKRRFRLGKILCYKLHPWLRSPSPSPCLTN